MDSKSSNDATDEHIAGIFAKYPNDEEASNQTETVKSLIYCTTQSKKIPIRTLVSFQIREC